MASLGKSFSWHIPKTFSSFPVYQPSFLSSPHEVDDRSSPPFLLFPERTGMYFIRFSPNRNSLPFLVGYVASNDTPFLPPFPPLPVLSAEVRTLFFLDFFLSPRTIHLGLFSLGRSQLFSFLLWERYAPFVLICPESFPIANKKVVPLPFFPLPRRDYHSDPFFPLSLPPFAHGVPLKENPPPLPLFS